MVKIDRLDDAFLEIFEQEASPVEVAKDEKRRKSKDEKKNEKEF